MKLNRKYQIGYWVVAVLLIMSVMIGIRDDHQAVWTSQNLETEESGIVQSPYIALKQGSYQLHMEYQISTDITSAAKIGEELLGEVELSKDVSVFDETIEIPYDTEFFRIEFNSAQSAEQVKKITLQGTHLFNYDTIFAALMVFLLISGIFFLLKSSLWARQSKEKKRTLFAIFITLIFTSLPFFRSQLFGAWDSWAHIARIQGITDALAIGQFPTIIFPENCNGFGQIGALYPLLFLYPAGILHGFGVSLTTCLNFEFILVNIATAAIMYLSMKSIIKSEYASGLATILYCLAPYRILNLFCRHALGELLAMIFIPLIIAGLYHLFVGDGKKYWYYLVIGFTGVIQSHIFTMVLVIGISLFFGVIYLKRLIVEKRMFLLLKTLAITIAFNLWYIVPYFFFFFDGVSNDVLRGDYTSKQTSLGELIASAHFTGDSGMGILSLIGIACIITTMFGFVLNRKNVDQTKTFMFVNFICALMNCLMVTTLFPWEPFLQNSVIAFLLEMIQFPSRFLSVAVPMLIMSLAFVLSISSSESTRKKWLCAALIVVNLACVFQLFTYALTDMGGRGSQDGNTRADFREYYPKDGGEQCCVNDQYFLYSYDTTVSDFSRQSGQVTFTYTSAGMHDYIDIPLMYYRGYQAKLQDQSGKKIGMLPVSKGEETRVRIELTKTQLPMSVVVTYGIPWYFAVTYLFSIVALVGTFIFYIRKRIRT